MFLWTLWKLFGIFVYVFMTALSCGFLNITRQTNWYFGYKNNLNGTKGTFVV